MNILQAGDGFFVFSLLQQIVGFIELFCNLVAFNHHAKKWGRKFSPESFQQLQEPQPPPAAERFEVNLKPAPPEVVIKSMLIGFA